MSILRLFRRATAYGAFTFFLAGCGGDDSYAGTRDDGYDVGRVDGTMDGRDDPGRNPGDRRPAPGATDGSGMRDPQNPGTRNQNAQNPGTQNPGTQPGSQAGALDAREFVREAASSGMYEVQAAQLAQRQEGLDAGVLELAQRLERDHQAANEELKNIAREQNLQVPETLAPKHQQMLDRLRPLTGERFTVEFVEQQQKAHQEAIALFERAGRQLSAGRLATFANEKVEVLRQHLQMVEQRRSGGTGQQPGTGR